MKSGIQRKAESKKKWKNNIISTKRATKNDNNQEETNQIKQQIKGKKPAKKNNWQTHPQQNIQKKK